MTAPGGLVRLYDWPEAPENLVRPQADWRFHPAFSLTETGLRLDCRVPMVTVPSATQAVILDPAWYVLRAQAKAEGNTNGSARVMLRIGGAIGPSTDEISGTAPWRKIERKFILVPARSPCQIRTEAYRSPDGVFEFERFELRRLVDPSAQAYLRYPNYRGLLWDDCPQTVVVWTRVAPGQVGELTVTAGEEMVYRIPLRSGEQVHEVEASTWPLKVGWSGCT